MRADKWLCFARFCRTRSLAAALVSEGRLRVNGQRVGRASHPVGVGDVLTFAQGERIRVVRILGLPRRRGPPAEALAFHAEVGPGSDAAAS